MDGKDWDDVRFWAQKLDENHPRTDLISLSDKELSEMLSSLDEAKGMPFPPQDDFYFFALKSAWSVIRNGGDDSGDAPDAYI